LQQEIHNSLIITFTIQKNSAPGKSGKPSN